MSRFLLGPTSLSNTLRKGLFSDLSDLTTPHAGGTKTFWILRSISLTYSKFTLLARCFILDLQQKITKLLYTHIQCVFNEAHVHNFLIFSTTFRSNIFLERSQCWIKLPQTQRYVHTWTELDGVYFFYQNPQNIHWNTHTHGTKWFRNFSPCSITYVQNKVSVTDRFTFLLSLKLQINDNHAKFSAKDIFRLANLRTLKAI